MIERLTHRVGAARRASDYLDGLLSPSARRRYQEHCRQCERCLATLRETAALRRRVDAVPRRLAPRGLAAQVVAEASRRRVLDLASLVDDPRPAQPLPRRRLAAACAALALVAVAFGIGRRTATGAGVPSALPPPTIEAPGSAAGPTAAERPHPDRSADPLATPAAEPGPTGPAVATPPTPTRLRPRRAVTPDDAAHARLRADDSSDPLRERVDPLRELGDPLRGLLDPLREPGPDLRPLEAMPATHGGPDAPPPPRDPEPTAGPGASRTSVRVEVHHREWSVRTR